MLPIKFCFVHLASSFYSGYPDLNPSDFSLICIQGSSVA